MAFLRLTDVDIKGKRVLIREDFNVPVKDGEVVSDARIVASLPTIRQALEGGGAVMVVSHLGRPIPGEPSADFSLQPVAERLGTLLGQPVPLVTHWIDGVEVAPGEVVLCENVRFLSGEETDEVHLARKMASLCDVFVMDAFATAHRAQVSTHGIAKFAPLACAGPLLAAELDTLERVLDAPKRPMIAIVGGAKVSTKLGILSALIDKVDQLIVGGGIANTFIAAAGYKVGASLYDKERVCLARELIDKAARRGAAIPLPVDVVLAEELSEKANAVIKPVGEVTANELILDIGPQTATHYAQALERAGTIIWNGPVGAFEFPPFSEGTRRIAQAIATSEAFSIAGGGDTLAAMSTLGIEDKVSYVSTGGGAFLEFLEGKPLPGVAVLMR